jgi:site-specific recombinase XerD
VSTATAIDRYLASPALADSTRRAYRVDLEEFARWLEARSTALDDVDVRVLADYAAGLGAARSGRMPRRLAPATIARKLAAVRAFLRFACPTRRSLLAAAAGCPRLPRPKR